MARSLMIRWLMHLTMCKARDNSHIKYVLLRIIGHNEVIGE